MFTIVFLSFHSEKNIRRLVYDTDKKYPIIIIENSLNIKLKDELEKTNDNVKVIIPPKNIGFSAGYNLGIRESKTDYVFLNPTDIILSKKCISELDECVSKIGDFSILAPTYDDEKTFKNYEIWNENKLNKNNNGEIFEKYKIKEVDFIDNDFIINKKNFKNSDFFDENMFIYFETMDFCRRSRYLNKKIYVCDKIKFTHFGGKSTDPKFSFQILLNRNWHYNWSKFYYFRKHFGYFYALKKISPNFFRSLKKMLIAKIKRNPKEYRLFKAELSGITNAIFNKPSSYRPFESEIN